MHLLDLFKIRSLFTHRNRRNPHQFLKLRPVKKDTPSGWSLRVYTVCHYKWSNPPPPTPKMFHILATPILKERQLCKQRGLGFGGSQIFSLRSRQNFNPSNPVSWQKKSTIHFSKAPTKTVRARIPSILGTIHFLPTQASLLQPTPPPLRMVGSCIGEFRFAFSKKATIFFILWTIFSNAPPKSQPIRVHQ